MKKPMTAEEFKNKEYSDVYWDENSAIDFSKNYSTYLLKHHLEQFGEECKENVKTNSDCPNWNCNGESIDKQSIDQTLSDYLTKNNIR